jgi:lysophospholipase L1-like esterase
MGWASRKGVAAIDTYKAFREDPRGIAALLETDGIHPNVDGSQVWADAVTGAFAAAI